MSTPDAACKLIVDGSQTQVSNILADGYDVYIRRQETPDERESRLRIAAADAKCERIKGIVILGFMLGSHMIVTLVGVAIFLFASSPAKLNGAALILAALLTSPLLSKHLSRK